MKSQKLSLTSLKLPLPDVSLEEYKQYAQENIIEVFQLQNPHKQV
jgi:hypothetical protein